MSSLMTSGGRRPAGLANPPPPGATLASFVLFASLAALLGLIYAGAEWYNLAGRLGFPSDAAWARAVFARNVATGNGLCFNPGTPSAGVAGPSWIAALSAVGFFSGEFLPSAKLLGVLSVTLAAFLTWHIALRLLGDWRFAFLGALFVAGSPRLASAALDGTESAWAALVVAAAVYWQGVGWGGTARQRAAAVAAVSLAALSRPELALLVLLVLIDRWLTAAVHEGGGREIRAALTFSLPELGAALAVLAPYIAYNWRAGGPLWQQPDIALRAQQQWAWAATAVGQLWADNPLLFCAAIIGFPAAIAAAGREHSGHPSFLPALLPLTVLLTPGLLWYRAAPGNGDHTAAYLTPVVAVLAVAGLRQLHRAGRRRLSPQQGGGRRLGFAAGIALVCASAILLGGLAHRVTWRQHGFQVKKVSDLQAFIGRWAADHLPPDASIASREVGAIGFFSRRRMVDLGGTIAQQGLAYLSRPGSPDANLLDYLDRTRPSHLAIRPSDFPDLSRRADLLTPAITCIVIDPFTGGKTTMTLYETPWPPPSVRDAWREARDE
jgi:hypothetical protein